jgi:hypothetical protein
MLGRSAAEYIDLAFTPDYLTVATDGLDRGSDLHNIISKKR